LAIKDKISGIDENSRCSEARTGNIHYFEEESPYKPEAYELRLFWRIAHAFAHKELQ